MPFDIRLGGILLFRLHADYTPFYLIGIIWLVYEWYKHRSLKRWLKKHLGIDDSKDVYQRPMGSKRKKCLDSIFLFFVTSKNAVFSAFFKLLKRVLALLQKDPQRL